MDSKTIRNSFISFFKEKKHQVVRSSPVVPHDDPTLLFTNAGMNQFKPIFLGEKRPDFLRAVDSQKCIRVSGKHNDLEEVGVDTFHHTFFEMMGNWSFGDYYKAEAIQWAWELITEVWGMDKNRLWATVFEDDDESFELWSQVTDIAPERILRCGAKDNFWEMGETGPCGPCSEIHYYMGEDPQQQDASGVNVSDEYWELWNLVFIQFNRDSEGALHDLPDKHVDTGAGLERLVTVLQNKTSNYDTDLFQPIIKQIEKLTGTHYIDNPIPHRVIADHIRMLSLSISDGAMPSNEGRGYVLRRILRRASRFGRILGRHKPFIYKLVDSVGEILGDVYPEIIDKKVHIRNVIKAEEISFNKTLDRGLTHFERILSNIKGNTIPGDEAFKLYDTYGFPLDLTQLLAKEKGLNVDETNFNLAMEEQKRQAKSAGKFKQKSVDLHWTVVREASDSKFLGYYSDTSESMIMRYAIRDDQILLVLDQTPFYGESGGQAGDKGLISGKGIDLQVLDTQKDGDTILHLCSGDFEPQKDTDSLKVTCDIRGGHRQNIRLNHTATHLLHKALKQVLGDHIHQAGSYVGPDYLRFDMTHFNKMAEDEIRQVESIVNNEIRKNIKVSVDVKSFDIARKEGAEALFGEKYSDQVRVVTIGDYSKELCGGTHVSRTGDIGSFKIIEESSLAAGVRRIVAITGEKVVEHVQKQDQIISKLQNQLKCSIEELPKRLDNLIISRRELEKDLKKARSVSKDDLDSLLANSEYYDSIQIITELTSVTNMDEIKDLGDRLLNKIKSGIGILGYQGEKNPGAVVVISQDLVKQGLNAGKMAKKIGALMGGGGGGRPHMATAGGKNPGQLSKAIAASSAVAIDEIKSIQKS